MNETKIRRTLRQLCKQRVATVSSLGTCGSLTKLSRTPPKTTRP